MSQASETTHPLIACVDVHYGETQATAACLCFRGWQAQVAQSEKLVSIDGIAEYEPGNFFRRELPCLLRVLEGIHADLIIVDGYVWLGDETHPGLGAHLYEALGQRIPVVGVAKTRFRSAHLAVPVCRGGSKSPLFVSTVGIDSKSAARFVSEMAGEFRVPLLLKQVDQLCRGLKKQSSTN